MDEATIRHTYEALQQQHNFMFPLKDEQVEVIVNMLIKTITITLLPSGYGKSITFILPPLIANKVISYTVYNLSLNN